MADAMFMYGVAAALFAFLAAVTFGSRAARRRRGTGDNAEPESHSSGGSSGGGKKAKKFKSDGTPVYE